MANMIFGMRRMMGLTTPDEDELHAQAQTPDEPMQMAQAQVPTEPRRIDPALGGQAGLDSLLRALPVQPAAPAPAPVPQPAATGIPGRLSPGTVMREQQSTMEAATQELRRQGGGLRNINPTLPKPVDESKKKGFFGGMLGVRG